MKKTASKSRPLSLRRETVRVLASSQLASAQGGGFTDLIRDRLTDADVSDLIGCLINPQLPPVTGSNRNGGCGTFPPGTDLIFP